MENIKLFCVSLGCDKNLVDTEKMLGLLNGRGITFTDDETEADVILVNTCCFIGDAKEESVNTILDMARYKEEGNLKALLVAGCLAQRYKQESLDEIPEDVAEKAKLMVVSYPNNPTTAMAPDSFYEELIAFASRHDIIVLHDNAYSDLVFDGRTCGSFLGFPGAKEVGVEFNSLSKTYGLAGARIGFCLGNEAVVSRIKLLKSNMDYGMFLPIQAAAIAAITGDQSCVHTTMKAYETRRNIMCDGFTGIGWKMERPAATMFVWAGIPGKFKSSEEFVMALVEKAGVMVTPGSAFGPSGEGYVRLALVQDEEMLNKAIRAVDASGILK